MDPEKKTIAAHRIPPHSKEAEQSILGSILQQPNSLPKIINSLDADDFYFTSHRHIFEGLVALFDKNEPQDLITITHHLKKKDRLESAGGPAYLASLSDQVPLASNLVYYAKIVREKAILRQLISTTSEIGSRCYEEQEEVEKLLDEVEQTVFDIARNQVGKYFQPLNQIITSTFDRITVLAERKELITGVPSGFEQFDKMTSGLQPSDLIIMAGRPSMGKTALAMNMVQNSALHHGVGVAVFSLEMSNTQLGLRLLCSQSRVDSHDLRTGFIKDHDWTKLTRAAAELSSASIFIDDTPSLSVLEMRAKARRLKSEYNIGLVVVDYLQLMRGRAESREQEISEISRSLKAMAKELDIPVIALSQLNRSLESRTDKRPQLADLRESGAIEQDADVICFIYRDEVYNKSEDNPRKGLAELIIGKQRNGPTGTVELAFIGRYTTFENLARTE